MNNQLTSNAEALRLFFTEDIYLENKAAKKTLNNSVNAEESIVAPTSAKQIEFNYLGKNQKNILILVNDQANEVSTLAGTELLRKLLNAIKLTTKDFALVNYANYKNTAYVAFESFFKCKQLIAFGVEARELDLPSALLHRLVEHRGARLIFTHNLTDLNEDLAGKKILWNSLQQL